MWGAVWKGKGRRVKERNGILLNIKPIQEHRLIVNLINKKIKNISPKVESLIIYLNRLTYYYFNYIPLRKNE